MNLEQRGYLLGPPNPSVLAHFCLTPWCIPFYHDPSLQAFENRSEPDRSSTQPTAGTLFRRTLNTSDTIAATQFFYRAPTNTPQTQPPPKHQPPPSHPEIVVLFSLGTDLNGHPDVLHGGFVSVILDEIIGTTAGLHRSVEKTTMTAYLNTTYTAPVLTPGPVVCRAWCERVEGRKIFAKGVLEDGEGNCLAIGEGLFIVVERIKPRMEGKL